MVTFPATPSDAEIKDLFGIANPPPPNTFEFALVLGGTVSAGAYTAGVVDFLVEALDEWTSRRDAVPNDPNVPPHKVVLKVITGTSGGGVNAAILSRALAYKFPHVTSATDRTLMSTGNPLYDIWVNSLSFTGFLGTSDIDQKQFVSLLNGSVIDNAAKAGVTYAGSAWQNRSWLAAPLSLITTFTNMYGVPYQTEFSGGAGDLSESFVNHADYARFSVVYPNQPVIEPRPDEFVLSFGTDKMVQAIDWPTLGEFAKGTSAFPLGFPARLLQRPMEHYRWRVAAVPGDGSPTYPDRIVPLVPDWSALVPAGQTQLPADYSCLVVDGGATNNEPIELAHTALAGLLGRNPRDGASANRGIVLVDPFAGATGLGPNSNLSFWGLPAPILQSLLQQTRYDTADLLLAADDNVFSRYMVTPIGSGTVGEKAIASAGAGAFIGFACRDFMRYDYLLGRANAQAFLKSQFVLDQSNPIFSNWPAALKTSNDYRIVDAKGNVFLPIIPLIGQAKVSETLDPWPRQKLNLESYRSLIDARFSAIVEYEGSGGLLSSIAAWAVAKFSQNSVSDIIINAMNSALTDWHLN